MAISKKIRFEVFKRDGFQCAYCGKTPPEVSLEVDHVQPKSKGGSDDINNLLTACFNCNRGKSNVELEKMPNKLNDNIEILKEKEEQLKEYRKYILKIRARIENDIDQVKAEFVQYFSEQRFTPQYRLSIKRFLEILDLYVVIDAMNRACLKKDYSTDAWSYFCGICWNIIKDRGAKHV